jgi:hypothetical protein
MLCKGCLAQMRDDRCPMCRAHINKLSKQQKLEIERRRHQDTFERYNTIGNQPQSLDESLPILQRGSVIIIPIHSGISFHPTTIYLQ